MTEPLVAACDGSALGNPGPAGWAWYVDEACWAAGGWPESTNNRGELQAVAELLASARGLDRDLHILCDSKYVINAVTKWMHKWRLNGWKKANREDVLNRDQLEVLDALVREYEAAGRRLRFEWVKGHAGHPLNEAADARAQAAARAFRDGAPVASGPGMEGLAAKAGPAPEERASSQRPPVVVSCPLEAELADRIVDRARASGRTPQEELADIIRKGMSLR
ncbi:ribonuclease H family protein [Brevibacterium album]|uniref:ribonuclease H family protein n=1 Tax=Brevibacterium album TaxID=417948 RepID=UPI0004234CE1|nr:ribonuclease H [Brevibacterium album]